MIYYVRYRVSGCEQEFEAGPYSRGEIESHLFDIAGYESVREAYIDPPLLEGQK